MQGVSKVKALRITGTVFQNAVALLSILPHVDNPSGFGYPSAQSRTAQDSSRSPAGDNREIGASPMQPPLP